MQNQQYMLKHLPLEGDKALVVVSGEVLDPIIIQDGTHATMSYVCSAPPGTLSSDNKWTIRRITSNCTIPTGYGKKNNIAITSVGTGLATIMEAPNGDFNGLFTLDNVTTYTYWR